MLRNSYGRRVVIAGLARAQELFAAVVGERDALKQELAEVRRDRDDLRHALRELQAAVQERWEAEQRCRELYREHAIARARAVERDPNAMLN